MSRLYTPILAVLILPLLALAQQATIQGVVTDPSEAFIPGVKVTATNTATGVAIPAQTNDQGFYSIPGLVPGSYRVEATADGFAPAVVSNLTLNVDQTARVDFALKVGTVAQAMEITAAGAIIDAETTTVGQVIDNKRIVELPLNGRNYLDLAQLTTGVAPSSGSRTASKGSFSALGMRAYQTNVLLDGIDNNSRASGGQLGFEAQAVTPSIDSVQEFKVVTNNNSAEYGFRMGGAVLVQTKSGTNEFHGTLYEFLRNEKLDAVNFFAVGQPRPAYKQNQFGANIGGRIIKDRTFFFGSFEGTRIRAGETSIATVPTLAYRSGNMTGARPLFDPASTRVTGASGTRTAFPNNQIPASQVDPVAAKVIALYPAPNLSGITNNHFFSGARSDDTNQVDARLDHNISQSHRLFGRYSRRMYDAVDPGPLPLPADGGLWTTTTLTSDSVVGNLNSTLSPSLNNEFRVGVTHTPSTLDVPWTENFNQQLGITGLADLGDDNARGMSRFTPTGYAEVGTRSFWPNRNNLNFLQLSDHLMQVRGRHVLKVGFEFRREDIFRRAARFARGQVAFNGSFSQDPNNRGNTGDGFADFLMGLASGGSIGNQNGENAITRNYSLYFQDDWRLTRRLTLNLGLRWDRFGIPSFKDSAVSRFEFAYGTQEYRIVRPEDESDHGGELDNNNFAPRVGLAWQVNDKTVFRSGFGLYYGQPDAISHDGDARFANLPPEFTEISLQTDRLVQPAMVVKNGFPTGLLPTTVIQENVTVKTAIPYMPSQYAMQWFADIQRQLPFQTVFTLSYLAAEARHLVWTRNINTPLTPGPGTLKFRRPWPFFGGINFRDPGGKSSYHGLAFKAEKRYSSGITFLGSYTWAHAIDDGAGTLDDGTAGGGARDPYNMRQQRGNSGYDVRHVVTISGVYDLPFGYGRQHMNVSGPADWILGGWQIGAIFNHRSGLPYSPTINGDLTNTGTANYPNRLREGTLPESQRTLDRWFDIAAFQVPAQYVYGNSGRNILFGPSSTSADLKIGKNFRIQERYRLEFRTEMFNFTNTPNFGRPNATTNLAQAGQIRSADAPRRIQFGLKFVY
jgi:outer membrane receptor protein involved in Fe transport